MCHLRIRLIGTHLEVSSVFLCDPSLILGGPESVAGPWSVLESGWGHLLIVQCSFNLHAGTYGGGNIVVYA
jgi:hypothetical protein